MLLLLLPVVAVVRRVAGRVPDGRQLCSDSMVVGPRRYTVQRGRRHVNGQSQQLHDDRLHDISACRHRTGDSRRSASYALPDLQQRPTHRLPLQPHRHT